MAGAVGTVPGQVREGCVEPVALHSFRRSCTCRHRCRRGVKAGRIYLDMHQSGLAGSTVSSRSHHTR